MGTLHPVTMPKWGLAMTEGMVAGWSVEEGATVAPGQEILDIETSKITNALEAEKGGVLRRRVAEPGVMLPVGALLGVIAEGEVAEQEVADFVAAFEARFAAEAAAADQTKAEPATVAVEGGPVRYLQLGRGDGPPIVLLHGFGGDLNNWLFNQPQLAESHVVYAFDLPGHGGSAKQIGDASVAGLARTMAGGLAALGIARAHLVGHSLGGAVALAMAAAEPGRAASLTLICPAGLGPEINQGFIDGFIAAGKRKDLKPHLEQLFADPALVTRDLVEDVLKFKRLDGVDAALRTIAGAVFPAGRQAASFRDRLAGLGIPVQVIWGAEDRIVPAAHAEGLPAGVAVHLLPHKGHMVHMEAAGDVNRLIDAIATP